MGEKETLKSRTPTPGRSYSMLKRTGCPQKQRSRFGITIRSITSLSLNSRMDCPFEPRVGLAEGFKESAVCEYILVIPVHNGDHFIKTFDESFVLTKLILGSFSSCEIHHRARYAYDLSGLIKCRLVRGKEGLPATLVTSGLVNLQVASPLSIQGLFYTSLDKRVQLRDDLSECLSIVVLNRETMHIGEPAVDVDVFQISTEEPR